MSSNFSKWLGNSLIVAGVISLVASPLAALAEDNFDAGVKMFNKKDFKRAKAYFDQAAADSPWDSNALYYQALTDQYLRDFNSAKAIYRKIAEQFQGTNAEKNAVAALRVLDPEYFRRKATEGKQQSSVSASPSVAAAAQNLPPVEVQAPAQCRIPVSRTGDKVLMNASVNNRSTRIEYAGSDSTLSMADAIQLGLVDKSRPPASGTKIPVTVRIGDIIEKNFAFTVGESERSKVGEDFFRPFSIALDPSQITATKKSTSASKGAYEVPFRKSGKDMTIDVVVNGRRVSVVYDEKASECVVPKNRAREFGLEVQEASSYNMFDPEKNPNGPVRGEAGFGEEKKQSFGEAKLQLGPVYNSGLRMKVDESAKDARIGPSAFSGWHCDVDSNAGVLRFSK